jgi:hypothetical protein
MFMSTFGQPCFAGICIPAALCFVRVLHCTIPKLFATTVWIRRVGSRGVFGDIKVVSGTFDTHMSWQSYSEGAGVVC